MGHRSLMQFFLKIFIYSGINIGNAGFLCWTSILLHEKYKFFNQGSYNKM